RRTPAPARRCRRARAPPAAARRYCPSWRSGPACIRPAAERASARPSARMPATVAYFCMEFGLHEQFPIYAGGLGILAGDFIKSGRDLGLPVVGVGLRWLHGYSRQRILPDGQPVDDFPTYRADFLEDTGVRVRVRIASREVEAR